MIRLAPSLSNFAQNARPRVPAAKRPPATRATGFRAFIRPPTIKAKPVAAPPRATAAPSTAAPAAAAAALPALQPLPPDASYEQQLAAAARNRDMTLQALGQQRTAGLQEFGYTEGAPGQVQFDANNPFSRAALLRKNYQQAQRGNTTGMAARGQLYSGALQNAQDFATRGFNEGENSLQRAAIAFLGQNTQRGTQARTDYETQASQADAERIQRAQDSVLYQAQLAAAALNDAPDAPAAGSPGAPPVVHVAAAPRKTKTVNGRKYRLGASGKWIPV